MRPEPVHQLCGDPPPSTSGDEGDATAFLQQVHELGMQAFGFDAAQPRDVVAPNGAVRGRQKRETVRDTVCESALSVTFRSATK
ncbi:hypothetical protein OG410_05540 [Streptomyces sp. NBC_00659]|uniref:hypothetical protein n=1 Tax=Streptomyces sp. NBC_00659 TaxID=2903669 RepID=UPI002E35CAC4|nr:hypothetical protein [Streptomyces sp. NBC_00659]